MRRLIYRVVGGVAAAWVRAGSPRSRGIRVLAYHAIDDPKSFDKQIAHVARYYDPVPGNLLPSGLDESRGARQVWVTLDDGDPSILDFGLDVLGRHGVPATAFICPGLIDTSEPYWWQIVEEAASLGLVIDRRKARNKDVAELKILSDKQRRARVKRLRAHLIRTRPEATRKRQLTTRELKEWVAAGHTLGNHTWDHPVLDTCDPSEQEFQIGAGHRWLMENFGSSRFFAYPNGNYTEHAHSFLVGLGYEVGALFDHRVHIGDRMRLSRIRVNASDPMDEFIAKLSGLHSRFHHARRRR